MSVNAIFEDRAGDVCFRGAVLGDARTSVFEGATLDLLRADQGSYYSRLGCFDGQRFHWFKPAAVTSFGWVQEQVTLQARTGEWWVGTGEGLYRFPAADHFAQLRTAKPRAVYTMAHGLAAPQVFRLFEDSQGNVWVSTISSSTNGLALWERLSERVRDLAHLPGLPPLTDDLPRSFGEDPFGSGLDWFQSWAGPLRAGSIHAVHRTRGIAAGRDHGHPCGSVRPRLARFRTRRARSRRRRQGRSDPPSSPIRRHKGCRATMPRSSAKTRTGTSTSAAGAGSTTSTPCQAASSISPPLTVWRRGSLAPPSAIVGVCSG